ncbi:asparaginase domain-containing protein [Methylobacterium sp. P31]
MQGTDTIEETAFVLDTLVASRHPVVVTGAMRGAGVPGADGPANLLAATIVAGSPRFEGLGTLVVLNDEVHAARFVQKTHTALPSAFASPGFAPVGRVIEGQAQCLARLARLPALPRPARTEESAVALVTPFLGDDGRLLDVLPDLGYRGVVIEAMGAGHLPAAFSERVSQLAAVMPVVLATRVAAGPVFERTYAFTGSETDLIARGAVPAGDLPGNKAALLLRLLLANGVRGEALRPHFSARSPIASAC